MVSLNISHRGRRNQTEQSRKGTKYAKERLPFCGFRSFLRSSISPPDEAIRIEISTPRQQKWHGLSSP
jgi:hypothetical protein